MELKQRSVGATTVTAATGEAVKQAETNEQEAPKEDIEQLKSWLEHFAGVYKFSASRKERLEDLMRRKSAKKWDPEKTAKMVRRLVDSSKTMEQAESALDMIKHRLSQNGIEVDVVSRSGEKAA